jgi:hypothetical protein
MKEPGLDLAWHRKALFELQRISHEITMHYWPNYTPNRCTDGLALHRASH